MHKRSLLIYGLAVIVLIAVGSLVWWQNRSSADINVPGTGKIWGHINYTMPDGNQERVDASVQITNKQTSEKESTFAESGVYSFQRLPYGTYKIGAYGHSFYKKDKKAATVCYTKLRGEVDDVLFQEGEPLNMLEKDITLHDELDEQNSAIQGYVKFENGDPVEGAEVKELPSPFYRDEDNSGSVVAKTNKDGYFLTGCGFQKNSDPYFIGVGDEEKNIAIDEAGKVYDVGTFVIPPIVQQPSGGGQGGAGGQGGSGGSGSGGGTPNP